MTSGRVVFRVVLFTALTGGLLLTVACGTKGRLEKLYSEGQSPVSKVEARDPEMNAAMQKARDTLDGFIRELQRPAGREFMIKARFPNSSGDFEHIWIGDLKYAAGIFQGRLKNEPVDIPGNRLGDPIAAKRENVSDWIIRDGEKMEGGFTVKVLTDREKKG